MIRSRARCSLPLALFVAAMSCSGASPSWSATQVQDGTWSALDASVPPPGARRGVAAAYDRANHRFIIFGGEDDRAPDPISLRQEIFELTLGDTPTWTELVVPNGPGERHAPQWGYDAANNRLLLFGGYGRHYPGSPLAYLNDVWQLSLDGTPTWTELFPSGTPPTGRLGGAAVYDPFRQRFVGFGGTVGMPVDTWELDLSGSPEWHAIATSGATPRGGYGMFSIHDPRTDRMVIFGGSTSDDYYGVHDEVWELRLRSQNPSWHRLTPAPGPAGRRSGTSVYDPRRNRMIIFAGWIGVPGLDAWLDDTWALSLHGNEEWSQLSPGGTIPEQRGVPSSGFDPLADRMVVFGGWAGDYMLQDTQFLSWGESGESASMTASSEAEPGVAHLQWSVQDATGTLGAVYRSVPGGAWESVATVESDASGHVMFDDTNVAAGGSYGYMVVMPSEQGEEFGGEEWVDVPTAAGVTPNAQAFALNQLRPHPVVDRFTVSFALPSAEPARLELMDLSGRRVFSREVGSLGAGSHQLELGSARAFAPGMYFLKLSQASRSATSRVVIQGSR